MYLRTLGGLRLDGSDIRRRKPLLVLAYLALDGPKNRRQLADLFWQDAKDPRDVLSTTIRRLNKGGQVVRVSNDGHVSTEVRCDAAEFEKAAGSLPHLALIDLYTGTFLDGVDLNLGEEIEEWLYNTRERLSDIYRNANVQVATDSFEAKDLSAAALHAERALDVRHAPPWHFQDLTEITRILQACSSPRSRDAVREAYDLGFVPNVESGHPNRTLPVHLPTLGTSFVGRQVELATIIGALATEHVRMLTLHGPGGVGKSRLALEAAKRVVDGGQAGDGVYFVPFETLNHADEAPGAIGTSMQIILAPDKPPDRQLIQVIGAKAVLLVLDNLEHLVACAPFLASLLRQCPNLRLLVTSRVRLGLAEEHVVNIRGLDVGLDQAEEGDAIALLHERMRQYGSLAQLPFDETGAEFEVCRLLHGAPLAIELAAALTRVMPLGMVAQELRSDLDLLVNLDHTSDTRHRSLHAALDVSWNLLDSAGQRALAQLSVFHGGFAAAAASAVANVGNAALAEFIDASLVQVLHSGRYTWHPFVKEHANRKLMERPGLRASAQKRHAQYYLERVVSLGHDMLGSTAMTAALWIEEEFANFKEAWSVALGDGDFGSVGLAAWPLVHFAEMRGYYVDISTLFEQAIAELSTRTRSENEDLALGQVLGCLAFLAFRLGRYEVAHESGSASVALLSELDPDAGIWGMWAARQGWALSSAYFGRLDHASELVAANLAMCEAKLALDLTDERLRRLIDVMAGTSHMTLVMIAAQGGAFEKALVHLGHATRLLKPHGAYGLGYVYWTLGQAHMSNGAVAEAQMHLEEGLRFIQETGFQAQEGYLLQELARVHLALGDADRAEVYSLEALNRALATGDAIVETGARVAYGQAALVDRRHDEARRRLTSAVNVARTHSCFPMAIEALEGLAGLDANENRLAEAIRQLAFVKHSSLAPEATVESASEALVRLRSLVPDEEFQNAYRQGKATTVDAAFALAAR